MRIRTVVTGISLGLSVLLAAGCGDETAPDESHHPHSAKLFVGPTELTPNVVLATASTVTVEIKFYAEDGDEITGIEADHFASLTFNPTALATVADVPGHNFQKTLTVGTPATGTVTIGYGHDAAADEESFGPFNVTVQ